MIMLAILVWMATGVITIPMAAAWWRSDISDYGGFEPRYFFIVTGPIAMLGDFIGWASADFPPLRMDWLPWVRHYRVGIGGPSYLFDAPKADPEHANTFGWRCWKWDIERHRLFSPSQGTLWPTPELRCDSWYDDEVVGGRAGIHASLVPNDWAKHLHPVYPRGDAWVEMRPDGTLAPCLVVTGIVERFDKFVLGTEGWRAEWVIIRKLHAPTTEIGLALEETFPDVEIVYD